MIQSDVNNAPLILNAPIIEISWIGIRKINEITAIILQVKIYFQDRVENGYRCRDTDDSRWVDYAIINTAECW